jgi:D-arginine utilization repressor
VTITAGLRDLEGELIGFLCINLDVTLIDEATAILKSFASSDMKRPEPSYRNARESRERLQPPG